MNKDTYKTIVEPSVEALYKEKNSKFFGYAFPVNNEDEVKQHIAHLKKIHHAARHWCYAYQLGEINKTYRANDDGEPNNSAGMPIYGQILSFDVTNVLIVVVRYFGGIKLGVSGLIHAYREAAKMSLENAEIVEKTIEAKLILQFGYEILNKVMRIIKEKNLTIISQDMRDECQLIIAVRLSEKEETQSAFSQIFGLHINEV